MGQILLAAGLPRLAELEPIVARLEAGTLAVAGTREAAISALETGSVDVLLDGFDPFLDLAHLSPSSTPIVLRLTNEPGPRRVAPSESALGAALPLALELAEQRRASPVAIELRTLAEHMPFDVWVRDKNDRCVYANETAKRHWGPEVVGQTVDKMNVPEHVRAMWTQTNRLALAGEVVRAGVDYDVEHEDGAYFNILAPIRHGSEVVGTVGVNIDMTAQRRAEAARQDRETMLRSIVDHTTLAIGVRQVRGDDILHLDDNVTIAELFGVPRQRLVGKTDGNLGASRETIDRTIALYRGAEASGESAPFELSVPSSSHEVRTFVGRMVALPVGPEGGSRFCFAAEDVTDARKVQSVLFHAERLISLGTMAAGVLHEIRNPTGYALLNLQYALEHFGPGDVGPNAASLPAVVESLRTALDGVSRIAVMLKDLQRIARREGGDKEQLRLNRMIDASLSLMAAELRVRNIRVDCDYQSEVPVVFGNSVRLGQVLLNLLSNAAHAIEEVSDPVICIKLRSDGARVRLEIADNGPGFDPAVRERLFEPFVTSKAPGTGTGLGLYVSRQIVADLKGSLTFAERDGWGAIALIDMPAFSATGGTQSR